MFLKTRTGLTVVATATALALSAPVALAAHHRVAPVTNLRVADASNTDQVKLVWDKPAYASTTSATIDSYIIKRGGHRLTTLVGFNGLLDTTYIDGSPSTRDATYAVIAVDSRGKRSPPTELDVPAPQQPAPAPPAANSDPRDGIQASGFCESIIPPDIRGHNQPTALEKYGCGKGMDTVNDKGPGHVLGISKDPIHSATQSLIQVLVSLGQMFSLLFSAMSIWVMQQTTYLGIGNLFAGILQTLNGDPNWAAMLSLSIAAALVVLGLRIARGQRSEGYVQAGIVCLALAVLSLLMSSPSTWMHKTVEWPLQGYSALNNWSVDLIAGTDVGNQYNLTVHPTYSGDKAYSALRKSENNDFLMFQYLPHCAINFDDYKWVINHYYPGTRTTWCEKFVQLWGGDNSDEQDAFKDKLKDSNQKVEDFFEGKDQLKRLMYAGMAKFVLFMQNMLKFTKNMSIFACMMLLVAEVFMMAVWALYAITGTDQSRAAAEQRIASMFRYLKIPAVMMLIYLANEAILAKVMNAHSGQGFLGMIFVAFLLDVIVAILMVRQLWRMRHIHKAVRAHLSNYRQSATTAAAAAATGVGAGAAATVYAARKTKQFGGWLKNGGADTAGDEARSSHASGPSEESQRRRPSHSTSSSTGNSRVSYGDTRTGSVTSHVTTSRPQTANSDNGGAQSGRKPDISSRLNGFRQKRQGSKPSRHESGLPHWNQDGNGDIGI
jgi:hypothetical protein